MTDRNYPELNVQLLEEAVAWAEEQASLDPMLSRWRQAEWVTLDWSEDPECGTAYCIAGYVGQLTELQYRRGGWAVAPASLAHIVPGHARGSGLHVSRYARHALGLTERESEVLFSGGNSIEDIRRIADNIITGKYREQVGGF